MVLSCILRLTPLEFIKASIEIVSSNGAVCQIGHFAGTPCPTFFIGVEYII
jgi:hypothetical protein